MECSTRTAKYCTTVLSIICALAGLITIGLSALTVHVMHHKHLTFCIFGIFVGSTVFVAAFFGFYGVKRNSIYCMLIYTVLLVLLLVTQIVILLTLTSRDFVKVATDDVEHSWLKEIKHPGYMANLEQEFRCCGLYSWRDYHAANLTVPASCYDNLDTSSEKFVFSDGCWLRLASISKHVKDIVQSTNWVLSMSEGIALIFSSFLIYDMRHGNENDYTSIP